MEKIRFIHVGVESDEPSKFKGIALEDTELYKFITEQKYQEELRLQKRVERMEEYFNRLFIRKKNGEETNK